MRACFVLLGGSVCGLGVAAAFSFYLLMYAPDLAPDF